tara:strand:+ start:350 stop:592 length:243 start_codon:yes stop_codon:yes gene_type:complete
MKSLNISRIFSIKEKNIIVVGGSRGIGKKIVNVFLNNQARVINLSRTFVKSKNKNFFSIQCDISKTNEIRNSYKIIKKKI